MERAVPASEIQGPLPTLPFHQAFELTRYTLTSVFSFTELVAFVFFILRYCLSFIRFSLLPYSYSFHLLLLVLCPVWICSVSRARPGSGLWPMVLRKAPGGGGVVDRGTRVGLRMSSCGCVHVCA